MTMKQTQHEGRYVLVGTLHSLLLVDLVEKKSITINNKYAFGGYYGFAVANKYIYIGVRNNRNHKPINGKYSNGEILVYDFNFNLCHILKPDFPLHDIHEFLWHDDKLYITNTKYDMIVIYDGISWEKWYPLGKQQNKDRYHFNSLTIDNNKLYICAHSFGPSTIYVFSLKDKKKIDEIKLGNCSHNIWFENNNMYVCSSDDGTIINSNGFIKHIAEWPRGIVLSKDSIIVGSSSLGGFATSRDNHDAHIYVYDNKWKAKGYLFLQGESQVFDIYPIEKNIDPSILFKDKRFTIQSHLGLSTTNTITDNEELLLTMYSINSLRSGRHTLQMNKQYSSLYGYTLRGMLSKMKSFIKKSLQNLL